MIVNTQALDLLDSGVSCVFVTGKAGTGKSTFLRYVQENRKNVVVLAPTGVAALNVGGQTIHSFFQLPLGVLNSSDIGYVRNKKIIRRLQLLIIDEISMVRADIMDAIDQALRSVRLTNVPFGGVKILLVGDLFQLPPVVQGEGVIRYFNDHYGGPYFFFAKVFQECQPQIVEFTEIYRQKDEKFIEILNEIREGRVPSDLLNSRVLPCQPGAITITTTNAAAAQRNDSRLMELQGPDFYYEADIEGDIDPKSYPTEDVLRLRIGAQVMLIRNDIGKRWVNGTIGEVDGLEEDKISVKIDNSSHFIEKEAWENVRYRYDSRTKEIKREIVGSFGQYPLKLAWAITIHKAQGKTFDRIHIDLGKGSFAHGQTYVALSRCTSLEGVTLSRKIEARDLIFDQRVLKFRQ